MATDLHSSSRPAIELSLVIPVYNGAFTIGPLVERIHRVCEGLRFEVVNDGSGDGSERACACLARQFPDTVLFVNLSRNFGEHSAVLAGLNHTRGDYVAVLDDDGQNPPEEVLRMLQEIKARHRDVVYGHYIEKQHSWFRNLGSRFNDRMATIMLEKPRDLYLSSFKVMSRFVVKEIIKYRGSFPYIDGLIYRTTTNIGQIAVQHESAPEGRSRYNLGTLVRLWLNMFLNFSLQPLRLSVYIGLFTSSMSIFMLLAIWVDKIINQNLTPGIPTVLGAIVFFSGMQLMILGLVGEYLGRLYLDHTGTPQFVVRYTLRGNRADGGAKTAASAALPEFPNGKLHPEPQPSNIHASHP